MRAFCSHLCSGVLLWGTLLILSSAALAQEPTTPFGQSNPFNLNTNSIGFGETAIMAITSVPENPPLPLLVSLANPMPNPFNPRITITFHVSQPNQVDLNIYDLKGRLIKQLTSQEFEAGRFTESWDGRNEKGSLMPAGVYLVRVQSGSTTDAKKIILVK